MNSRHIPDTHTDVPVEERGFLKIGECPKTGAEKVHEFLTACGAHVPPPAISGATIQE